jgi:hypothetical protein
VRLIPFVRQFGLDADSYPPRQAQPRAPGHSCLGHPRRPGLQDLGIQLPHMT